MSSVDRRGFIKTSSAAAAAAAAAGSLPWAGRAVGAPPLVADDGTIPPQRVQILYGLHAYTDQLSVQPGEEIQFHATSTVPYNLSVCRLGQEVDDPAGDEVLKEFAASPPQIQPIRPGSYIQVPQGLEDEKPIETMTIECWLRPFLSDTPAGIITQFDLPQVCGFGLFLNPNYRVSFYLGTGGQYEPSQLHHTPENTLQRDRWHHIVARWDGKVKTIWIDGVQVASWPFEGPVRAGSAPLRLGARGDWGETFRLLDADIAMPAIYASALSDQEIRDRYEQKALSQPQADSLLACWPLYEERGSVVADISGHGRHGRIINNGTWMVGGPSFDAGGVPRWGDYDPQTDPTRGHGLRLASDDLFDCRWEPTHKMQIPKDARSGFYVGRYRYKLNGTERMYHTLFFVRPAADKKNKPPICLLAATNTYRAYTYRPFAEVPPKLKFNDYSIPNSPGSPPAYSFYGGDKAGHVAYRLGLRMPSPNSGPYVNSMSHGTEHNYSHLARADRLTEVWLAKNGYDYDVITDLDLHRNPEILKGYKTFIINGHSEYWSLPAYYAVDRYLAQDEGNVVVMSGNTMFWRVTYDDDYRTIECRKIDAPGNPIPPSRRGESYHSDDFARGGLMRDCGFPAWKVLGMECLGWNGEVNNMGPFVAANTDHFLYREPEDTGLEDGEHFGIAAGGFPCAGGHEFDVRVSTLVKLQQGALPEGASVPVEPEKIEYLGHSIHQWRPNAYICDYYTRRIEEPGDLGGEMIYWERPEGGRIFHAGVIAGGWVLSIDPKFETMMRNVLSHFGVERNV